tara:strand:- start:62 stop:475 length:414 start_codon:yes stop_codon:yes gene_type:complete
MYERDTSNPENNQVLETCNYLLQYAVEKAGIKKRQSMTFTNIRHTAFYLMVKENRNEFITDGEIETFARNGHTSLIPFRDTYINKVDAEGLVAKVRKRTMNDASNWELNLGRKRISKEKMEEYRTKARTYKNTSKSA